MSYEVWGEPDDVPECPHCDENKQVADELAALVRRLAHALKIREPDNGLVRQASDYLKRNDLDGSPLRDDA